MISIFFVTIVASVVVFGEYEDSGMYGPPEYNYNYYGTGTGTPESDYCSDGMCSPDYQNYYEPEAEAESYVPASNENYYYGTPAADSYANYGSENNMNNYPDYNNYQYYENSGNYENQEPDCVEQHCMQQIEDCFFNPVCHSTLMDWMTSDVCEHPNEATMPYSQCYDPNFQSQSCSQHSMNNGECSADECANQIAALAECHGQHCEEPKEEHCVFVSCSAEIRECENNPGCAEALNKAMSGHCDNCQSEDCCSSTQMCQSTTPDINNGCIENWEALGWCYYANCEEHHEEQVVQENIPPKVLAQKSKKGLNKLFASSGSGKHQISKVRQSLRKIRSRKQRQLFSKKRVTKQQKSRVARHLKNKFKVKAKKHKSKHKQRRSRARGRQSIKKRQRPRRQQQHKSKQRQRTRTRKH